MASNMLTCIVCLLCMVIVMRWDELEVKEVGGGKEGYIASYYISGFKAQINLYIWQSEAGLNLFWTKVEFLQWLWASYSHIHFRLRGA